MRLRIYIDGIPSWSENQPSHARLSGIRGCMATGLSGVVERDRQHRALQQKAYMARKKAGFADNPLERTPPDARESVA